MSWGSVVAGVLKLVNVVMSYFKDQQLLDAGKAQQKAATQDETLKNVDKARHAGRRAAKRGPDGKFVQDDPFDSAE